MDGKIMTDHSTRPDLSEEQIESYGKDGFIILRGFWKPELIKAIVAEYDKAFPLLGTGPGPREKPLVVFWTHAEGGRKRVEPLENLPCLRSLVLDRWIARAVMTLSGTQEARLLETAIINKPPRTGAVLHWHQDVSFFPLDPGHVISTWVALDQSSPENGAVSYACGSHNHGRVGSVNLLTGEIYSGERLEPIRQNPENLGYKVVSPAMEPGDLMLLDGKVWHMSGQNRSDHARRGIVVRYMAGKNLFRPRVGMGATFINQIDVKDGNPIEGQAFPLLSEG